MSIISKFFTALLTILIFPAAANDGGSGLTAWYNQLWGIESVRAKIAACEPILSTDDPGLLGYSNALFCRLEKELGITGPTGTSGVTGSYDFFGTNIFIHAVVSGSVGGASFNGYDYEATIWGCREHTGVACDSTGQYEKFGYITWTSKADHTVSRGVIVQDQYIQNGSSGFYVKTTWNTGSLATTKTMVTKFYEGRYALYAKISETGNLKYALINQYLQSVGMRFAASFDTSAGTVRTTLDVQSTTMNANKNDAVSFTNCYDRYVDGDDYSAAPNNNAGACDSAPAVTNLDESLVDLSNYTNATIIDPSEGFALMATHPANL